MLLLLFASSGTGAAVVPDVDDADVSATMAIAAIIAAGLTAALGVSQYSYDVPAGYVISQTPAPGTLANFGDVVTIVISLGSPILIGRLDVSSSAIGALTRRIAEGDALRLTLRVLSPDLALIAPTTLRYRIDDLNQGSAVLEWTTLTPTATTNVIVTSAQNAMRSGLSVERRQIVFEASDSDGPQRKTYEYDISNLQGIPG